MAGHGVYSTGRDPAYYYLTADTRVDDLEETAISFDKVEALLDGLRARHKLFLLDTCQSGEYSPEESRQVHIQASARGMVARSFELTRGIVRKSVGAAGRPPLLQRDRFIYQDLFRRTGAIVFSSSMGHEVSLEKDRWRNGAFTEALQAALSGAADHDGDGAVDTVELRQYVRAAVPEMTGRMQHPTVDRDNITSRFAFPTQKR